MENIEVESVRDRPRYPCSCLKHKLECTSVIIVPAHMAVDKKDHFITDCPECAKDEMWAQERRVREFEVMMGTYRPYARGGGPCARDLGDL